MTKIFALVAILCLPAAAAVLQMGGNGINGFKDVPVNLLEKSNDCAAGVCTFNQFIEGSGVFAVLPDQSGDVVAISDPAGSGWETLPFWFAKDTADEELTLEWEIAGFKSRNEFGWYDLGAPNVLHLLFQGIDNAPASIAKTFNPSINFGLYLKSPQGTFRSNDASTSNMFALYLNTNTDLLYIGAEDVTQGSDRDFNDMILNIRTNRDRSLNPSPEPGTYAMMGTGLGAIWLVMRRRRS